MKAAEIRRFMDYHIALNRKLWERCIEGLPLQQFTRDLDYSIGSIRNQTVHMMSVDKNWFVSLQGGPRGPALDPAEFPDQAAVRARWDQVEAGMREALDGLTDERMGEEFAPGFAVWEALLHVVNHGTDHRAQVLAMLHGMGVEGFAQDFIYHVLGRDV